MKNRFLLFVALVAPILLFGASSVESQYQEVKSDYEKYQRICDAARNDAHLDIAFLRALKANETFVTLFNRYSGTKAEDLFIGAERAVKRVTMKPPKRKKTDDSLVASIDTELKLLDMRNDHSIEAVRRRTELVQKREDILKMLKKEESDEQLRYKKALSSQRRAKNAAVAPYVEQVEKVGEKIVAEVERLNPEIVKAREKARDDAAAELKAQKQRVVAAREWREKELEPMRRAAQAARNRRFASVATPTQEEERKYRRNRIWYQCELSGRLDEVSFHNNTANGCLDVELALQDIRRGYGNGDIVKIRWLKDQIIYAGKLEESFAEELISTRFAIYVYERKYLPKSDLSEEEKNLQITERVYETAVREEDDKTREAERRLKEAERAVEDAKADIQKWKQRVKSAAETQRRDAQAREIAEEAEKIYCVIDLSGGDAASYPVTYFSAAPKGGFDTREYKTTKLVLKRIEPGTFIMGSNQKNGRCSVKITKPFYLGLFEVTQKQWDLVMGTNVPRGKGEAFPVGNVSYSMIRGGSKGSWWPESNDVDETSFLGQLRARTKIDFDLPTEAQWEFACRAGTTTRYSYGDREDGRYMWYNGNAGGSVHVVGEKRPNPWGFYDMHGNAFEWCRDWHIGGEGDVRFGVDPKGPSQGRGKGRAIGRVIRGGSVNQDASKSVSFRPGQNEWERPTTVYFDVGFRLCLPTK